jgi:nucleoside-diphosphate-sugar epimerase/predicted dehydrogenase
MICQDHMSITERACEYIEDNAKDVETSMPARIPRLLFLGGGAVVAELYVPALERLGWVEHVLVVEPLQRSIDVLQGRQPSLKIQRGDFRECLNDSRTAGSFDAVVVALPNHLHENAVTGALNAGLHVLCEKPLASNSALCTRLAIAAERQGRVLSVAMVRRLIPAVIAIREALKADLVGSLQEAEILHGGKFAWPSDSGHYFRKEHGGILLNMGVHYLDLAEDWVGPLTPCSYKDDYAGGVEANCDYRLLGGGRTPVRLKLSFTHQLPNTITIIGSRGKIVTHVNTFDSCTWTSNIGVGGTLRPRRPFVLEHWPPDFVSSFSQQLVDFALTIEGRMAARVTGEQAAATGRLIEWAYEHRTPLFSRGTAVTWRPTLTPGPVVVTGGSGFVGGKLVERLVELQCRDIRVPVRSYRSGANVARFPVERILTNLLDSDSLEAVLKDARYVFHLAYAAEGAKQRQITLRGTKKVVEAAIRNACEVVVVVSTASVFGHPTTNRLVDETFPYKPSLGSYGRSKAAAERYCLKRARSSGKTRIVVVNPTAIYGPGGGLFTEFPARAAHGGYFAWIEDGKGKLNYSFVDNVVDALVLAASRSDINGRRFIISDGVCTVREFLTPILGDRAASLPSFTREELESRQASRRPGIRSFVAALANREMLELVNRTPALALPKRILRHCLGETYEHVKRLCIERPGTVGQQTPAHADPPVWLAEIFGAFHSEYCSDRARKELRWEPLVPLHIGEQLSTEWLTFLDIGPCRSEGIRVREESYESQLCT